MAAQTEIEALLSGDGPLAQRLTGFRVRTQQLEMAKAIAETIAARQCLIAEAGTGTGKTFAYLVPALTSGAKVLISTGTKTLQDQLFERDLPLVRDALKLPLTVAQLKGRNNYICLQRLQEAQQQDLYPTRQDVHYMKSIVSFAATSATGDRSTFDAVPENALIWPLVTSTRENCLGSQCPYAEDCFLIKARKAALEADVVVINHHLFFADALLREEGMELLPECSTIIIDEAHQLPDTATAFFGERIGSNVLADFVRDAEIACRKSAADVPELLTRLDQLKTAVAQLRLALGNTPGKLAAGEVRRIDGFNEALTTLNDKLLVVKEGLDSVAVKGEDLKLQAENSDKLCTMLQHWGDEKSAAEDVTDPAQVFIRWAEISNYGWQLYTSPLSVASIFRKYVEESESAWILTSATLAVGEDFTHFQRELGLEKARTAQWGSPFNYKEMAQLYVPKDMPVPNSPEHTEAVIQAALPVLETSNGAAFFLFTSHRALRQAKERLSEIFAERAYSWKLLVQGTAAKPELLSRFREEGNAVLLGAASFWEGVDVAGDALKLVIIDKLPFAPPDDPLLVARLDFLKRNGGNPFFDWQIPQAAISLKQGAGRLIRSETDRGVLMICDTRLVEKSYGKKLWQSLPPMRRTRELEKVKAFFGRQRTEDGLQKPSPGLAALGHPLPQAGEG